MLWFASLTTSLRTGRRSHAVRRLATRKRRKVSAANPSDQPAPNATATRYVTNDAR
jgi:hypothetical protein